MIIKSYIPGVDSILSLDRLSTLKINSSFLLSGIEEYEKRRYNLKRTTKLKEITHQKTYKKVAEQGYRVFESINHYGIHNEMIYFVK